MHNHGPHFFQAPHKPVPPSYQQLPTASRPHFRSVLPHQSLPPPPSLPPPLSHVYQHDPSGACSVIPQAPFMQVQSQGIVNINQSYFHTQPPLHGSTLFPPGYLNAKQNSLAPPQSGVHTMHNAPHPRSTFIGNPPPEFIQPAPFKLLPPHHTSPVETIYRAPVNVVPQHGHGGIQALQNLPLPPYPPRPQATFSFSAPAPAPTTSSDIENPAFGDSVIPSVTPPPPSSPPPLPPSPPPSISLPSSFSVASDSVSNVTCISIVDPGSHSFPGNSVRTLESPDEVISPNQVRYNVGNQLNQKGESGFVPVGSMMNDELSSDRSEILDRPSPPSKPTEQNNGKVETLCQSIAENVPVIEKMACQNESQNLSFGGKPGSGDAITDERSSRASQECNQPNCLIVSAGNNTPADSDMEMEDDITPVLQEQGLIESIQVINHESMDYGGKEPVQGSHSPSTWSAANGVSYERVSCSSSLSQGKQEAVEADDADKSSQLIKNSSPFRLIQVYASDDDSENDKEPCNREVSPMAVLPIVAASGMLSKVTTLNNFTNVKIKNSNWDVEEIDPLPKSLLCNQDSEVLTKYRREANKTGETSEIKVDDGGGHQTSVCGNIACKGDKSGNDTEEKKANLVTSPLKVDEFGRLVREGFSDSDSDDSSYIRRDYKRAQRRNRSRSHSPADRKRKRGSPRRRRERRSRSSSRSWSPRIQRNRNRSPFRRGREFSSKARQGRGQVPVCFDFNRGRCNRGASCHYMHHESSKNIRTRYNRGKQQYTDVHLTSIKNQNSSVEPEVLDIEHNEVKTASEPLSHDLPSKVGGIDRTEQEYMRGGVELNVLDKNNGLTDSDLCRHQNSGDRAGTVEKAQVLREKRDEVSSLVPLEAVEPFSSLPSKGISHELPLDFDATKPGGDASQDGVPSVTDSVIFPSQSNYVPKLDSPYCASPQRFSKSEPFPDKISPSQSGFCTSSSIELVLSQQPSPHYPAMKEFSHLTCPAIEFSHSPSQLPPPPPLPLPLPQSVSATNVPQLPRDYTPMPQATSFPFQFTQTENFGYPQVSSFNQHSQTSGLPSSSWIRPLPHQPLYDLTPNAGTSNYGSSFQLKNAFLPMPEPQRPFSNMNDFPGKPPGVDYPPSLAIGGLSLKREEHLMQNVGALDSSSLLDQRNLNTEYRPLSHELLADKMQYSLDKNFHSGVLWKSSSQIHPNSEFQPSRFNLQVAADGSQLGLSEAGSVSLPLPTSFPDFVGSRFPSHHNPYASTFEKPLPFNFSTGVWKQRDDTPSSNKSGTDFCLNVQVGEQGFASVGSKQTSASPSSTTAIGQVLHKSGTDQYDPLLDCIEPSSSLRKSNTVKVREQTGDSDIIMRSSCLHKPLYFEENVEAGADASSTSRNDEFGERADAEVGAVENQSQGEANLTGGEIEIDQSKSEGKKKKSKSFRSTKLFKISIANFVKEVLKPSWRQGNMSEEAFKTIVKKSVEKVAGAMKSHHIPKSQAKINRYIDSSQRKLMKLVMGYVNKYVGR